MSTNRLAQEKSPYLQQHARNPVDWYPWGDEAFEKAQREDRPVFLSIGYSTCHWCHVMAHESFEDPDVAKLLNDGFVCVKVDREERPDIDNVYMAVCQMMGGNCGWPLTIIMTPQKRPFLATTYIPKESRFGRQGMMQLIPQVTKLWNERRDELARLADGITATMGRKPEKAASTEPDRRVLDEACGMLERSFDEANGGFGSAPKFPSAHNIIFLLGRWKRTGDGRLLEMAERTLAAMAHGGIWDHVGFGFHRYSTDAGWLVPHFEKMLYDQAMLAMAYTEAYQATRNEDHARTARRTLEYVRRDMASAEGAFFSAEDADSEGGEGRFYVWKESELRDILGPDDASLAIKAFGVTRRGNFTEDAATTTAGQNILHMAASTAEMAGVLRCGEPALKDRLERVRQDLFEARSKRVRPPRDEKLLADWNGLMVAALAKAGRVLDDEQFAEAARKAARFILENMRLDGRLLHMHRQGSAPIQGNLEDHAFVVWGLLELYGLDFEPSVLEQALELNRAMLDHFRDKDKGGFYFTPDDGEKLLVRPKEAYDGALPSGNSVAASNLLRLARLTGDHGLEEMARDIFKAFSLDINSNPAAHSHMLSALDMALAPSREVVIAGKAGAPDTGALLAALRKQFDPGLTVMLRHDGKKGEQLAGMAPFVKDMGPVDGKAAAYVCTGGSCRRPVTDIAEMMRALSSN